MALTTSGQQSSSICTFHSRKGLAGARQVPWYDGTLELGRDSRAPGLQGSYPPSPGTPGPAGHCRYRAIARGSFAPVRPAPVGTGLGNGSHCPGGPFVHPHQTRCAACPLRPFQALRIPYCAFRIPAFRITRHTRIADRHRGSRFARRSYFWKSAHPITPRFCARADEGSPDSAIRDHRALQLSGCIIGPTAPEP